MAFVSEGNLDPKHPMKPQGNKTPGCHATLDIGHMKIKMFLKKFQIGQGIAGWPMMMCN